MSGIALSDAIADLRRELTRALEQGADDTVRFAVGPVELELQVELTASASGKAETKWWVVSAAGELSGERATTHRLKLTLQPQIDGASLQIAAESRVGRARG